MRHARLFATAITLLSSAGCLHAQDKAIALADAPDQPAAAPVPTAPPPEFPYVRYTTSWLGNSYGGPTWVQRYTNDLYTMPDGTCAMATGWDEGGHEYSLYKGGKVMGAATATHGWGYGGGGAVTANSRYLFLAQVVGHMGDDSGLVWPPKGTAWFGIGRRKLDGSDAPFAGGKGHGSDAKAGGIFLPVNSVPLKTDGSIAGLAASDKQLFASDPYSGQIDVFDPETMAKTASWPLPRARHLAYDPASDSLWIVQAGEGDTPPSIHHYTAAGAVAGPDVPLPAGTIAGGLCVSRDGHLLVTDLGPSQQVLIFGNLNGQLALERTLGDKGGIYSGVPGRVAPLKFSSPVGVGTDAAGNIYVVSNPGGAVLESYAPDGKRNWEVHGLEFVECADIDLASPNDAYTADHHYTLDLSKPSGRDSTYTGYLIDQFGQPNDPRLVGKGVGSMFARRIGGKLLLYGLDMNASMIQVFRFTGQGELTAPSVIYHTSTGRAGYPANQPAANGYIWRDANGDGKFDAAEFESSTETLTTTSWSIDTRGDIWTGHTTWRGHDLVSFIRHLPCQGLDAVGNPIYSFKSVIDTPMPAPFDDGHNGSQLTRMQYVAETDSMYLSGFTPDHRNLNRDWKTSGSVVCRYDNWSAKPVLRWQIAVPFESAQTAHSNHMTPDAFSVAGNRLFNGYLVNGEIHVYDTGDGHYLGSLLPGPEVDKTSGWIDTMYGVRAEQLADGEYLVFAEEVWHEKVLMYRLK